MLSRRTQEHLILHLLWIAEGRQWIFFHEILTSSSSQSSRGHYGVSWCFCGDSCLGRTYTRLAAFDSQRAILRLSPGCQDSPHLHLAQAAKPFLSFWSLAILERWQLRRQSLQVWATTPAQFIKEGRRYVSNRKIMKIGIFNLRPNFLSTMRHLCHTSSSRVSGLFGEGDRKSVRARNGEWLLGYSVWGQSRDTPVEGTVYAGIQSLGIPPKQVTVGSPSFSLLCSSLCTPQLRNSWPEGRYPKMFLQWPLPTATYVCLMQWYRHSTKSPTIYTESTGAWRTLESHYLRTQSTRFPADILNLTRQRPHKAH